MDVRFSRGDMLRFSIDDHDIQIDAATLTLRVTMTFDEPDFSEEALIEAGWRTMASLGIRRLIVTVAPAGSRHSRRN